MSDFPSIPGFQVVREIGRGGMGIVYEAEQLALGRRVALKILPMSSADSEQAVQRFRREAQAAAAMHHTNIVPVFEVGSHQKQHYYAMQFIVGEGLDRVISQLKTLRNSDRAGELLNPEADATQAQFSTVTQFYYGESTPVDNPEDKNTVPQNFETQSQAEIPSLSLSTNPENEETTNSQRQKGIPRINTTRASRSYFRNVAKLGVEIASALQHSHQRGIIHRDIKPSNILLDREQRPWVADFGLAKALDTNLTRSGSIVGTIRYMAPERFRGECDATSDIYALGATLYELLTLQPLFDTEDQLQLIEKIKHQQPTRPSLHDRSIPKDLETIVVKCLAKDPSRRYSSGAQLGDDLTRFLDGRPILARRVGPLERFGMWTRANPAWASLVAVVFLSLSAFSVYWKIQSDRYRQIAKRELEARTQTEGIRDFIVNAVAQVKPGQSGRAVTVYESLKRELPNIESQFADDPLTRGQLLVTFGSVLTSLGETDEAVESLENGLVLVKQTSGETSKETINAMGNLLDAYVSASRTNGVLELAESAHQLALENFADDAELVLATKVNLGAANYHLGNDPQALAILRPAAEEARQLFGNSDEETLRLLAMLSDILHWTDSDDEGLQLSREVFETTKKQFGPDSFRTARAADALLGSLAEVDSESDEIEPLEKLVLDIYTRELGDEHELVLVRHRGTAIKLLDAGQYVEAIAALKACHQNMVNALGEEHFETIYTLGEIARAHMMADDYPSAIPVLEQACLLGEVAMPASHPLLLRMLVGLGNAYNREQMQPQALNVYVKVRKAAVEAHGPLETNAISALRQIGSIQLNSGLFEDAIVSLGEVVEAIGQVMGREHPLTANMMFGLIQAQLNAGKHQLAVQTCDDVILRLRNAQPLDLRSIAAAQTYLAEAQLSVGDFERAQTAVEKARELASNLDTEKDSFRLNMIDLTYDLAFAENADTAAMDNFRDAYDRLYRSALDLSESERWALLRYANLASSVFDPHEGAAERGFTAAELQDIRSRMETLNNIHVKASE